jgi:DNA-binding NarL/FixJ family response regulator
MIRVLLADDQSLVRSGFRVLLAETEGIEVVGEASDGRQALTMARQSRADVILMDIRMPVIDGLEATRQLSADQNLAGVKVLILTTFEADEYVFEALRAGASGFLTKDVELPELIHAIRVVARGDALLAPRVTQRLIARVLSRSDRPRPAPQALSVLTDREREVMTLVGKGLTNEEIAADLHLSPLTAKTHVSRAMIKLGARDRTGWTRRPSPPACRTTPPTPRYAPTPGTPPPGAVGAISPIRM